MALRNPLLLIFDRSSPFILNSVKFTISVESVVNFPAAGTPFPEF